METGPLHRQRGVTLIELMFGITVLAILLGIGAPSFADLIRAQRTTALTNDFVMTLQMARGEAMRRSTPVAICPSTNGTTCVATATTNWDGGWILFTDGTGTAGRLDVTDQLLSSFPAAVQGYTVRTNVTFIRFLRNGATAPAGNKNVVVQRTGCSGEKARRVQTTTVGRFTTVPVNCT